jgi:coenzyme F420-dependent glucose-6-phosphate dehydrogenase
VIRFSYHISHEQFSPHELLQLVGEAELRGFDAAFSSDHLQPWIPAQGHSGFIWAWLGAALQATSHLTFAGITIPGNWRYHPAVVAQAIATLGEMFPGRLPWIALGSGEALNEAVIGEPWPDKAQRDARLMEGAQIIRALLDGERVTRSGSIPVENARIWSRPSRPTQLCAAALSESTARWAASWADGLVTVGTRLPQLTGVVQAFRSVAGNKPIHAKIDVSWAPSEEQALLQAHEQWRAHALPGGPPPSARTPEEMEHAARAVPPESLREVVLVSSNLDQFIEWICERAALGLASIDIHNVGRNQHEFIEVFGACVLPAVRSRLLRTRLTAEAPAP